MSTNATWHRGRRARRGRDGGLSRRLAWLLGGLLVCVGALAGAFGTVAWLAVLCAPSFPQILVGVFALGVAPIAGGGALLWAGLSVLEAESARSRVRAVPDARMIDAARGGATAKMIALRLGLGDQAEVERRLDHLVARDALALDVTEEGEVRYRVPSPS